MAEPSPSLPAALSHSVAEAAQTAVAVPRGSVWLYLLAVAAGMLNTLSFAPTAHGGWLELLIMGGLFALLGRTRSWRSAALAGGSFGFGNFVTGIWWLYVSMHDNGGMAAPLAIAALVVLALGLALFPALASTLWWWVARRSIALDAATPHGWRSTLSFAAAWTLGNWVRGTALSGFPWLASGYPQVDGPLRHYAALLGVYGVGCVMVLVAAACVQAGQQYLGWRTGRKTRLTARAAQPAQAKHNQRAIFRADALARAAALAPLALALALVGGSYALAYVPWTHPSGAPLSVRLLQGNVPEDIKFSQAGIDHAIDLYQKLITEHPADLVITPETGMPVLIQQVPEDWGQAVRAFVDSTHSAVVFGAVGASETDGVYGHYTNSLYGVTPAINKLYRYDKYHLVPFGESTPDGFHWFVSLMYMPMGDFDRGAPVQAPFFVHGQPISFDICYEDVFGEEIARTLREQPTPAAILVNATNLGWFGNTIALPQHLQMARMRALETGRPMLSVTNTGPTAAIAADGRIEAQLPTMSIGSLAVTVQGRSGFTPYVRWGNTPVVLAALALLALCVGPLRRKVAKAGQYR
jgi:apolipoprotein N-acyltransferase